MFYDMQMIRVDDGSHNLSLGEPYILQKAIPEIHSNFNVNTLHYPPAEGEKDLIEALKKVHPGKHIIVTNGAKQAISCAIYAAKDQTQIDEIAITEPYWPTYRSISKLFNCWTVNYQSTRQIRVNVSPNNPDGEENPVLCDIWDAAYAHRLYGWSGNAPPHDMAVYSAAKLFGLSGLRVGWLVTGNSHQAKLAAQYMEITTSGVCVEAQRHLTRVIGLYKAGKLDGGYLKAREWLLVNGEIFNDRISKFCDDLNGVPVSGKGMFAWMKVAHNDISRFDQALRDANVRVVTGQACGMEETGWYRLSMGLLNENTDKALSVLKKCMDG